ncbi:MAG: hypothetical protein WBB01_11015 [Phormidesmis sp.]
MGTAHAVFSLFSKEQINLKKTREISDRTIALAEPISPTNPLLN